MTGRADGASAQRPECAAPVDGDARIRRSNAPTCCPHVFTLVLDLPPPPPSPAASGSSVDLLKRVVDVCIVLNLTDGVGWHRVLLYLDIYMSSALEQTEEHVSGMITRCYGDSFIRGNTGTCSRLYSVSDALMPPQRSSPLHIRPHGLL
ncbi:uncharacterized protein B0H18DRAFT_899040 [Fomitopsis serialis]|uniref:uncharacterized protein n=1 Tax=Fomitopsis serialis TaxID=139415 RepID=UPI0020080F20|nr:uncharacterized protein B0H18DRAFT_899040 [Neoantrodia serialis]KAH9905563.1 hypothetical protein B0H18DRAFT_899040 [Neoantrodia serialis]